MRRLLAVLIIACTAFVLSSCGKIGEAYIPEDGTAIAVEIASGSTAVTICATLEEQGIIENADSFRKWLKKNSYDANLKAGKYTLSPSMSYEQIAEILVGGKVNTITFTIPEGLTYWETAQKLANQNVGDYAKFIDVIQNGDFSMYSFIDSSLGKKKLEGYLLPNTYVVDEGFTEEQVIKFLLNQFEKNCLSVYASASSDIKDKYSLSDIVKVASLIEREAGKENEKGLVASVIYNRLKDKERLGFCSSVQYILLETTGTVHNPLLYKDMEIDDPYNTYIYQGLTPTPICSPSLSSIKAACNPEKTNYKYFVLSYKLDGSSEFSETYEQHLALSEKYYKAAGLK